MSKYPRQEHAETKKGKAKKAAPLVIKELHKAVMLRSKTQNEYQKKKTL